MTTTRYATQPITLHYSMIEKRHSNSYQNDREIPCHAFQPAIPNPAQKSIFLQVRVLPVGYTNPSNPSER